MIFIILAIFFAWVITATDVLSILIVMIVLGVILGTVGAGNIYGIVLIIHTINLIQSERKKQRDDLITLTPLGQLGMLYNILYIALNRPRFIKHLITGLFDLTMATILYFIFLMALLILSGLSLGDLGGYIGLFIVAIVIHYETIQSVILGGMIGGFIASYKSSDQTSTQVLAIGLLFILQAIIYGASIGIFMLMTTINLNSNTINIMVSLAILFSSREGLICIIFHRLRQIYGENERELATQYNKL